MTKLTKWIVFGKSVKTIYRSASADAYLRLKEKNEIFKRTLDVQGDYFNARFFT